MGRPSALNDELPPSGVLADRTPYTFEVDWEETVTNSMLYPKRQPDMLAFCGDKVSEWVKTTHGTVDPHWPALCAS